MYVTTNLPITKKWSGRIFVVPLDTARGIIEVEVEVAKNGTVKTLKSAVGQLVNLEPKRLIATEEWKHKLYKEWHDDDMVSDITDNDRIIFFETTAPYAQPRRYGNRSAPAIVAADGSTPVIVPVTHKRMSSRGTSTRKFGISDDSEPFGSPFILTMSAEEATTVAGIKRAIAKQYARVTKRGDELLQIIEEEIEALELERAQSAGDVVGAEIPATAPSDVTPAATSSAPSPAPDAMEVDRTSGTASPVLQPSTAVLPGDVSSLSSSTASLEPLLPNNPESMVASSSSSLAAGSTKSSRRSAFQIQVSKDASEGRVPMGQDRSFYSSDIIDLDKFEAARSSAPVVQDADIDMFGPGSAKPVDAAAAEQPAPQSQAAGPLPPLLKTGQSVTVTWNEQAIDYFFSEEASAWQETQKVVDPALEARRQQGKGSKRTITLSDCLTEFTKEERLGEDDMWYCSSCKEHKQATKKVELWKVPDVLVFALKRFSSSRYSRDKIDELVDFPVLEALDMEPFVEGDRVEKRLAEQMPDAPYVTEPDSLSYELYAVSNHFGGLGGGHYTAFAKNPENGRWYDFDDVS